MRVMITNTYLNICELIHIQEEQGYATQRLWRESRCNDKATTKSVDRQWDRLLQILNRFQIAHIRRRDLETHELKLLITITQSEFDSKFMPIRVKYAYLCEKRIKQKENQIHRRKYIETLKTDPVRYARYRAIQNASRRRWYLKLKNNPEKWASWVEFKRLTGRNKHGVRLREKTSRVCKSI